MRICKSNSYVSINFCESDNHGLRPEAGHASEYGCLSPRLKSYFNHADGNREPFQGRRYGKYNR